MLRDILKESLYRLTIYISKAQTSISLHILYLYLLECILDLFIHIKLFTFWIGERLKPSTLIYFLNFTEYTFDAVLIWSRRDIDNISDSIPFHECYSLFRDMSWMLIHENAYTLSFVVLYENLKEADKILRIHRSLLDDNMLNTSLLWDCS